MNPTDNNLEMIIRTHEKAVSYAAGLLSSGEIIIAKSILDQTLTNLNRM
jgi:hypothetical protein